MENIGSDYKQVVYSPASMTMTTTTTTTTPQSPQSPNSPPSSVGGGSGMQANGAPMIMSPCAACKILRRRCADKCVLAPYFPPTDPLKFTIAHKVFGASNIIKLLQVYIIYPLIFLCAQNFLLDRLAVKHDSYFA